MTVKQIRPSIELLPAKQAESELFIRLTDMIDSEVDKFSNAIVDVSSKYTDPSSVSKRVVEEVFRENGLPSVVDLLNSNEVVDHNTVLAFSAYILLFKGSRSGYETVLRLMGFEYTMIEWWENGGNNIPNTFSIDVNLNETTSDSPYATFQKIKKFTSEYVFPVIFPLGFTYTIDFRGPQIACHAAIQNNIDSTLSGSVQENLVYGPSNWVVTDETFAQNWTMKINRDGELKAFKTEREPTVFINLVSDTGIQWAPIISSQGDISFIRATVLRGNRSFVNLMDYEYNNWFIYISGPGSVQIGTGFATFDSLLTEDFLFVLQESEFIIIL